MLQVCCPSPSAPLYRRPESIRRPEGQHCLTAKGPCRQASPLSQLLMLMVGPLLLYPLLQAKSWTKRPYCPPPPHSWSRALLCQRSASLLLVCRLGFLACSMLATLTCSCFRVHVGSAVLCNKVLAGSPDCHLKDNVYIRADLPFIQTLLSA